MLRFVVALAFAVFLSAPALAQSAADGQFVSDIHAKPCVGRPVQLRDIAHNPSTFEGQCVRTRGIVHGWGLFTNVAAIYDRSERDSAERVGLYPQGVAEDLNGAVEADVTGVVGDCGAFRSPDILMVLGYCHHFGGAYLAVTNISPRGGQIARLVGEHNRVRYGDLAFAPPRWSQLPVVRDLAERWRLSVFHHDLAAYARLSGREETSLDPSDRASGEYLLFTATDSPFAFLRGRVSPPETAIFVPKEPGHARADPRRTKEDREALVCFCRTDDCRSLWPISESDARDDPVRPFACIEVYAAFGHPDAWIVRLHTGGNGLAEPSAATARRR